MKLPAIVVSRRILLGLFGTAALAGCPDNKDDDKDEEDEDDDGEKKKKKDKGKKDKDKKKKKDDEDGPAKLERQAYALGRKYGFACIFATLGKDDAVSRNMAQVTLAAKSLGVDAPSSPTKENGIETLRTTKVSQSIKDKHNVPIAAACEVGLGLSDAFFGTQLEADISDQIASVKKNVALTNVPKNTYESPLTTLEGSATSDNLKALSKAIDTHYQYAG